MKVGEGVPCSLNVVRLLCWVEECCLFVCVLLCVLSVLFGRVCFGVESRKPVLGYNSCVEWCHSGLGCFVWEPEGFLVCCFVVVVCVFFCVCGMLGSWRPSFVCVVRVVGYSQVGQKGLHTLEVPV